MRRLHRRRFLMVAAGLAAGAAANHALRTAHQREAWPLVKRTSFALGTEVSFLVRHPDVEMVERACDAAFAELALVDELMSIYRADSQLSILNRDGVLAKPHRYLVEVLEQARRTASDTDGAFDITVQPMWRAYASAAEKKQLPDAAQIEQLRSTVDWRQIAVSDREVRLLRPGMRATLNGIAQGYAADRAAAVLAEHGIEHALVNTGEIKALGESERKDAWRIGVQHPRSADDFLAIAPLDGRALATSGDYATTFSDDLRHNHILDPRTGKSPSELCSVSILAPSGMEADALSTACFVLGVDRSLSLIARRRNVDALLVRKDGELIWSRGFPVQSTGRFS